MYKISLNKILKSNIFIFIFLFLQFAPQSINYVPSFSKVNMIINYSRVLIYILIMVILAFSKHKHKNETRSIVWLIVIFFIVLILSSIINKESIAHTSYTMFQLSVFCIYVSMILNSKSREFVKIGFYVLYIMTLINFILILALPNGIYMTPYYHNTIYFLGSKNGFFSIIIILAVLSKISYNEKIIKKGNYVISNIIAIITMLISNSSTGIIAFAVFLILQFIQLKKKTFFILYKYAIIICLVISVGVCVFRVQNYLSDLIYKAFGKTTTLTGRTYIWDSAIEMIRDKPILGYGLNLKNGVIRQGRTYYYSHNLLLETMISGGIVALACLVNVLMVMSKKIKKASKYNTNEYCILAAIISYMIMGITEAPITAKGLYLFIILSVYYANENKIEGENIDENLKKLRI